MKKSILFLNDNKRVLLDMRENFDSEIYILYFVEDVQEALSILAKNRINLFIVDVDSPNMDGTVLLKKVKKEFPLTVRMAISENISEELIFKLFNNNLCKDIASKPLNKYELIKNIEQLIAIEEKLKSREILSTINTLDKLPVLPDTYITVNQMIEDDEDINNIAEIIENDAALSLKILQIANSAFYRIKTGAIKTAIITLGLVNIRNIILTASIFDFFDNNSHKKKLLWRHALITNKIVLGLYRSLLHKNLSNLYSSAGMLHDIGKIILCKNYPENYMKIFDIIQERRTTFTEAEKEVLSICNGEIGAYLLDWWDIPAPIVEAALYHETPWECSESNRELVSVVHIASYYAWKAQNIITDEQIDETVFDYLGLSRKECEKVVHSIVDEVI